MRSSPILFVLIPLALALALGSCDGAPQPATPRKTTISSTLWIIALQTTGERYGVFLDLADVRAVGPNRRQFKFEIVYSQQEPNRMRRVITTYLRDCRTGETFFTDTLMFYWSGRPPSHIRVVRKENKRPGQLLWDTGRFVCLPDAQRKAEKSPFMKFNVPLEDQESFVQTIKPKSAS